jgi:hypothetical protein
MNNYFIRILIGLDQLITTIVGGYPDETISSYMYRLDKQNKIAGRVFRPMIDSLFRIFRQHNHCFNSYEEERLRLQMPPMLR